MMPGIVTAHLKQLLHASQIDEKAPLENLKYDDQRFQDNDEPTPQVIPT